MLNNTTETTMTKTTTVSVNARKYEDADDCLTAAADAYVAEHPEATGWDLSPRWQDEQRDAILLDVPLVDAEV